jgi:hypothetical protein
VESVFDPESLLFERKTGHSRFCFIFSATDAWIGRLVGGERSEVEPSVALLNGRFSLLIRGRVLPRQTGVFALNNLPPFCSTESGEQLIRSTKAPDAVRWELV